MTPARAWIVNQYALPRGATGITRHGDLASVMQKHGLDVSVIASSFDNFVRSGTASTDLQRNTFHDGVRFSWIKTSSYRKNDARRVLNMIEFYVRVVGARLAKGYGKPDVVVGSSPHLLSALAALHLARRYRARFVLELRDVWPDDLVAMGALSEGGMTHRALTALARHLERQADHIIAVPPKLKPALEARTIPGEKILNLPNGVFLDEDARPAPLPDSLIEELRMCQDAFVVMYMGAHGQANGLSNVLDAAKLLSRDGGSKVAFVLIGGGQERDQLIERARKEGIDNVRFHAPVPKAAVPTAAAKADALMVHLAPAPTFDTYGRSPNKLYDYLAAGKPVLYSTADKSTIVDRAEAGITFQPGSPRALAEAVRRLAEMAPIAREAMGSRGRAALVGEHDLAVLGCRLAQLITELAPKAQRASATASRLESPYS